MQAIFSTCGFPKTFVGRQQNDILLHQMRQVRYTGLHGWSVIIAATLQYVNSLRRSLSIVFNCELFDHAKSQMDSLNLPDSISVRTK